MNPLLFRCVHRPDVSHFRARRPTPGLQSPDGRLRGTDQPERPGVVGAARSGYAGPVDEAEPTAGAPTAPRAVWVILPTYNEAQNVSRMIRAVLAVLSADELDPTVLVVDDASPDGTGRLADAEAARDPRVRVLRRAERGGIGPAYRAGFELALAGGAELIVEMDCDFSHPPDALPGLIAAANDADLVIGSRYVPGGAIERWGSVRRMVSRVGCAYARTVLGVPVRDLTSGFKCFRREVLTALPIGEVSSRGYGFQVEMTYRALRAGFRVREVPITFTERQDGESKMGLGIVAEAIVLVPRLRLGRARRAPRA